MYDHDSFEFFPFFSIPRSASAGAVVVIVVVVVLLLPRSALARRQLASSVRFMIEITTHRLAVDPDSRGRRECLQLAASLWLGLPRISFVISDRCTGNFGHFVRKIIKIYICCNITAMAT